MDTSMTIFVLGVAYLYATGHWIAATIVVAFWYVGLLMED